MRWSPAEIPEIFKVHWAADPKEPFQLTGEPSTVKSMSVYQESWRTSEAMAREFLDWNRASLEKKQEALVHPEKYFVFADVRASETDIGELRLQDMSHEIQWISYKYNLLFEVLGKKDVVGVLFLDEMNLAPNMIKAQFYKIINDRCIGDMPLADGVLVISAGNESEHARGVTEDPVPLVLRRANYFVRPPTAEEFVKYALETEHHPYVIGYLGFQPQDVHSIRYDLSDSVGQPCTRTWSKLSNIMKGSKLQDEEIVRTVAIGLVGQGVGVKFYAYAKAARKVDLDSVLREPKLIEQFEADTSNLSLLYAIFAGVTERFRHDPKVLRPAMEMSLFIKRAELGAYLLRSMKLANEKAFARAATSDKIVENDLMQRVVERYAKLLFDK